MYPTGLILLFASLYSPVCLADRSNITSARATPLSLFESWSNLSDTASTVLNDAAELFSCSTTTSSELRVPHQPGLESIVDSAQLVIAPIEQEVDQYVHVGDAEIDDHTSLLSHELGGATAIVSSARNSSEAVELATLPDEQDLENFQIQWGVLENYNLSTMLGEGEYSEAFEAIDTRSDRQFVVKVLKPVSKRRLKREIKILQDLSDGPNIVKLFEVVQDSEEKKPALVTEFVNNTEPEDLYPTFKDIDVRFYIFQLLRAVEYAHERDIMHRDIKPYNVMIDHNNRKLRLIDWGLSDYFNENLSYTTHVASRYWRAPELLVDYEWYGPSSDVWAVGCMLAALVFGQEPFFRGRHSDVGQLVEISRLLGTEALFQWLDKYEISLPEAYNDTYGWHKKRSWGSIVSWQFRSRVDDNVLDLLDRILVYDHYNRLTASEALAHRYFEPVRELAMSDPASYTIWDQETVPDG